MIRAVIGILALVVVGAVAIGITQDVISDEAPEWSYDDYKLIDGVVAASGSLEMIETHLGPTVHAIGVGPGTITYSDGSVMKVDVERAKLDVYLMTGQSNACYYDADPALADPVPDLGEAYAWMLPNGKYGQFILGEIPHMLPMVNIDGSAVTGDKATPFAATVGELTGHKTYWICGGWGGQSITQFDPAGGPIWLYMKDVVNDAMDAIDRSLFEVKTCYYMWIQGEADRTMAVEEYKDRFIEMHDAIIGGDLGYSFSHCFISLVRGGNSVQASEELAQELPTVSIGSSAALDFTQENGLVGEDDIHYSQLGDNIIGVDLGTVCGELRGDSPAGTKGLMGIIPIILGVVIGCMAIGLALRALMGRD